MIFAGFGAMIYIIVMMILRGDEGVNSYGPDPLNPRAGGNIFVP